LIDVQQITGNTYDLGSTGPNNDGVDGDYGPKTAAAVRKFKADEKLGFTQFGDVGPGTIHRLDELFSAGPAPPSPTPPPSPAPQPSPVPPPPAPTTQRKRVTVNITQLAGSTRNPSSSIASAVKIYAQAGIDIVARANPPLSDAQSKQILGNELVLDETFFGSPTTEERALFQINNRPDEVSIYFVKKMEDFIGQGDNGESFDAACGVGIVGGVVGTLAMTRRWPTSWGTC